MKVTTIRLPEGLYDDLAEEAEQRDKSISEHIRDIVRARHAQTNTRENTQPTTQPTTLPNTPGDIAALRERVEAVEQRLTRLEGRSDEKGTEYTAEHMREYTTEHEGEYIDPETTPDGEPADPPEAAGDESEVDPREIDLPGSGERLRARQDAVMRMYEHLRRKGSATKADFLTFVDADEVSYSSAGSFWSNSAADALADLPGVDRAGIGEHSWRYLTDSDGGEEE